jgi:adenylosuccinate lyase
MIDRYCTPAMTFIWSRSAKYDRWLEVEVAICDGWAKRGVIPAADMDVIRSKSAYTLERCDEIELETRHDLVAFVRNLEENVGPAGRWIHFGVTSYDVIDTALGMMLRDSCDVLLASLDGLAATVKGLADKHASIPMIGRTHAIHAEPITFGFKLSSWKAELDRSRARLEEAKKDVAVGKISGAVGIHAHVAPEMEAEICSALSLGVDPVSTQIVNRDRLANLLCVMAVLAGGLERIATELRNLQRTEILEVQEEFAKGQTGSSAMPHKRNPWNSETVCGLSRIVRGNTHAMLETIATWHERDLTNSSLERIILPDTFHLVDFMMNRLARILRGLVVMPDNMATNLRKMGDLVFSEHLMVMLVGKGLARADAYKVAQRNAAAAWDGTDFKTSVYADETVKEHLSAEELAEIFSLEHHLRNSGHSLEVTGLK